MPTHTNKTTKSIRVDTLLLLACFSGFFTCRMLHGINCHHLSFFGPRMEIICDFNRDTHSEICEGAYSNKQNTKLHMFSYFITAQPALVASSHIKF